MLILHLVLSGKALFLVEFDMLPRMRLRLYSLGTTKHEVGDVSPLMSAEIFATSSNGRTRVLSNSKCSWSGIAACSLGSVLCSLVSIFLELSHLMSSRAGCRARMDLIIMKVEFHLVSTGVMIFTYLTLTLLLASCVIFSHSLRMRSWSSELL